MDDQKHAHFHCALCGSRTTKALSLGMLGCRYHPHIDGALKPTPEHIHNAANVCMKTAGNCLACRASYFNQHSFMISATHSGCTAIDHLSLNDLREAKVRNVGHYLMQHPYEVMPRAQYEKRHAYKATANPNSVIPRYRSTHCGGPTVFVINKLSDMYEQGAQESLMVHIQLHQPAASQCSVGNAQLCKKIDNGLWLSLENLYNECAMKYNYAPLNESPWVRKVLHANRFTLASGDKDTGGGVATMTKDQICERELYADEFAMQEFDDFVPFVVVLRVEARKAHITARQEERKNNAAPQQTFTSYV